MLIRNIDDAALKPIELDGVQNAKMAIMVGREDGAPTFALRQIRVDAGGHTPKHSHDYEHEVYVVGGAGTVLLEGAEHPIKSGDVIYVPADEVHQFRAAEADELRFLCLVPVSRNCGEVTPGS
ncbi:MAG: cupin domain-containing protein [Phycisphaerales bacterium]|nr:cupin domain-containing protein [Phycisphaerales bacterium]